MYHYSSTPEYKTKNKIRALTAAVVVATLGATYFYGKSNGRIQVYVSKEMNGSTLAEIVQ